MIASVPCQHCPEPIKVEFTEVGDRLKLLSYSWPACSHQNNPTRLLNEAARIHATATEGGDPNGEAVETPAGPQGSGIAEPAPADGVDLRDCCGPTILEPSRCWCGFHALPTGHSILHCASEAGHARDAALRGAS